MLPTVKTTIISTVTAAALALSAAAPAQALGDNEKNFLKGVAAAIVVDRILDDVRANNRARVVQPQPVYQPPVYNTPVYQRPVYQQPSLYQTPAAKAFNAYTASERRAIQRRLAAAGYYRSGIDGAFGPGTYNAVTAYARDIGASERLASREGAFGVYDALIY